MFSLGALNRIHPWVRLNGLSDFCTPWNCQKIIAVLTVLGEGQSLTGLPELFCMVPLFWRYFTGVTLVFRWYFGVFLWCSGCNVQLFCHCSAVFRVPLFRVPVFLVL